MSVTARSLGIARSLAMYYGVPLRARRLRRFYAPFVAPGSLCFDVGAHAGNRVRCWRQLGARVVAIEPQPDFVRLLRWLYGRDPGVEILPVAVGRNAGRAELLISTRTPTVSTLSPSWVQAAQRDPSFKGVTWERGERVEIVTLQSLIERYGEPAFIKVDVEGFEAEVLASLAIPVRSLSFEYVRAMRDVALECLDRLEALGRYRYNWSRGETHRFASTEWLDASDMSAVLTGLPVGDNSGDVYAVRADG